MRVEEDGGALASQLLEQDPHDAAPCRVERRRRLVEDEDARRADERLRDAETLLHPLRHAVHPAVASIGEGDELEQPLPLGGTAFGARQPLVEAEHLVGRVPTREAKELGEVAELRPRSARAGTGARDLGPSASGAHEPDRDLDERRLPGAVRPEQSHELTLLHRQVDALERLDGPVALCELVDGERRGHTARVQPLPSCNAARLHGGSRRRGGGAPGR